MLQPWFLDIDHTMRLHRSLIETYGGSEGIRDVGLLHSALAMPQASFGGEFLHRDLFEMRRPISTTLFKTIRSSMETNVPARLLQSFFFL